MSIMVGIGRGAGLGVLIKNAEALERMEKIDTLVVDKTGTLTEGRPSVTRIIPATGYEETELLRLAAGVERASEHPLALAVIAAAKDRGIVLPEVADFDSPTGKGAIGTVDGKRITLGNARFLSENGIDVSALEPQADELRQDGATAIFIGIDKQAAGILAIADAIKATTAEAIAALRKEGIRVVMLTGDNRTTAEAVGPSPAPRPWKKRRPTKLPSATTALSEPSTWASGWSSGTSIGWTRWNRPSGPFSAMPTKRMRKPSAAASAMSAAITWRMPVVATWSKSSSVPKARLARMVSLCAASTPSMSKLGSASA